MEENRFILTSHPNPGKPRMAAKPGYPYNRSGYQAD